MEEKGTGWKVDSWASATPKEKAKYLEPVGCSLAEIKEERPDSHSRPFLFVSIEYVFRSR